MPCIFGYIHLTNTFAKIITKIHGKYKFRKQNVVKNRFCLDRFFQKSKKKFKNRFFFKSIFFSKIEKKFKNRFFSEKKIKNRNFWQKIKVFSKNTNFPQKYKFLY